MAVVNLGSFGRPRENPIGQGIREAGNAIHQSSMQKRELESRERIATADRATREGGLSAELASQTLRKRQQDLKNVSERHDLFSLWWNGMDEQEQEIAKSSDQYKELQKFFKGFKDLTPGLVEDNGDIVARPPKDIFQNKLMERVAQAKMAVAEGKASEEDIQLLRMDSRKIELTAKALEYAAKNVDKNADQQGIMEKVGEFFQGLFGGGQGSGNQNSRALQQPTPGQDERDPLGILQ